MKRRDAVRRLARLAWGCLPGVLLLASAPVGAQGPPASVTTGPDARINVPGDEALPNCNVQSTVTMARSGNDVVAGWADAGECDLAMRRRAETVDNAVPGQGRTSYSLSGYGWSSDGGRTWNDGGVIPPPPGGTAFGDSVLAAGPDGVFYYATLARDADARSIIGVARSEDGGRTFGIPVDATPAGSSTAFQDKPWMAVDTSPTSPFRGTVYVAWTEIDRDPRLRIRLARSRDGGRSFGVPVWVDGERPTAHFGVQVAVGPNGEVYVTWFYDDSHLMFTRSLDGGVTFSRPTNPIRPRKIGTTARPCLVEVDSDRWLLHGDIRVRNWPSLAVDTSGSSDPAASDYNPYRGRIYIAIPYNVHEWGWDPDDQSDVGVAYSKDGGTSWERVQLDDVGRHNPVRIHDDDTLNDQFHPQIAVGPDGVVAVAWYDRRLSAHPLRPNWDIDVFAAVSTDGGETFGPNFRVTDRSFPPAQVNPNTSFFRPCYMGDYNSLIAGEPGEFLVGWGDNRDETTPGHPDPNVYFDRILLGGTSPPS